MQFSLHYESVLLLLVQQDHFLRLYQKLRSKDAQLYMSVNAIIWLERITKQNKKNNSDIENNNIYGSLPTLKPILRNRNIYILPFIMVYVQCVWLPNGTMMMNQHVRCGNRHIAWLSLYVCLLLCDTLFSGRNAGSKFYTLNLAIAEYKEKHNVWLVCASEMNEERAWEMKKQDTQREGDRNAVRRSILKIR